jgi:2-keto-4-pentenoate hydratase/2-oxohepta-3-ene-1,7-dioic acid hydratase in catechol pathway
MKLLRYGEKGMEKPGCLDAAGQLRDLSAHCADINGAVLSPTALQTLQQLDTEQLPRVLGQPRLGPCVTGVGKFMGIGLNYADHAAETGANIPTEPVLFLKATSAICGPDDPILIPRGSSKTDWEVELGVVIGKAAKYVSVAHALEHVAGYCVINDVSERAFQKERGGQWDKGKGCDTFGPLGPWLVTADEVPDPQQLTLWLDVDGKRCQDGSTRNMIFSVAEIVSYLSQFFTLHPGDVIATGTPAGVGMGRKPEPVYLKAGQVVKLGVAGLGEQVHRMVADV